MKAMSAGVRGSSPAGTAGVRRGRVSVPNLGYTDRAGRGDDIGGPG